MLTVKANAHADSLMVYEYHVKEKCSIECVMRGRAITSIPFHFTFNVLSYSRSLGEVAGVWKKTLPYFVLDSNSFRIYYDSVIRQMAITIHRHNYEIII